MAKWLWRSTRNSVSHSGEDNLSQLINHSFHCTHIFVIRNPFIRNQMNNILDFKIVKKLSALNVFGMKLSILSFHKY